MSRERYAVQDRPYADDLRVIGDRPWWLYDPVDYLGRSRKEIVAGLTVPATEDAPR